MLLQILAANWLGSAILSESHFVKIRLRTEFKASAKTGPGGGRISKPTG